MTRDDTPSRFNRRQLAFGALVLLAVAYYGGRWAYNRFLKSEEDHIRDLLQAAAQGARERSPSDVSAILSEDFSAPGGVNKERARQGLVFILMQQYRVVEVSLHPDPIPVAIDPADSRTASAVFRPKVRGKLEMELPFEDVMGQWRGASDMEFKATFKKTDKGWRMSRIEFVARGAEQ